MQTLVVGLGQFGMTLAQSLTERNAEVIGVDIDARKVEKAANFVVEALQMDVTEEGALASVAPQRRDLAVCAIGEDDREASIISTAILRQIGAPHVVARAVDDLHARILRLVGAHEVVHPERAFAERLAVRLAHRRILDVLPLGDDLVITEFAVPPSFVGHTLVELRLRQRFDLTVMAIRRQDDDDVRVVLPTPDMPLQVGDVLLLVGHSSSTRDLVELA